MKNVPDRLGYELFREEALRAAEASGTAHVEIEDGLAGLKEARALPRAILLAILLVLLVAILAFPVRGAFQTMGAIEIEGEEQVVSPSRGRIWVEAPPSGKEVLKGALVATFVPDGRESGGQSRLPGASAPIHILSPASGTLTPTTVRSGAQVLGGEVIATLRTSRERRVMVVGAVEDLRGLDLPEGAEGVAKLDYPCSASLPLTLVSVTEVLRGQGGAASGSASMVRLVGMLDSAEVRCGGRIVSLAEGVPARISVFREPQSVARHLMRAAGFKDGTAVPRAAGAPGHAQ